MNWKIESPDIAIHKILDLYEKFKIEKETNLKFSTQLPLEDYINRNMLELLNKHKELVNENRGDTP